jgi:hypothetical protein
METENIFFMTEKTFFLTWTMVPASDKIFCVMHTTGFDIGTMVFANENIFAAGLTKLFVPGKIFSVAATSFFAG